MEGVTLGGAATPALHDTPTHSGAPPPSPMSPATKRRRKEVACPMSPPQPPAAVDTPLTAQSRRSSSRLRGALSAAAAKAEAAEAAAEAPCASPAAVAGAAAEVAVAAAAAAVADAPRSGAEVALRGCAVVAAAAVEAAVAAGNVAVVGGKRPRGSSATVGGASKRRGKAGRVVRLGPDETEPSPGGEGEGAAGGQAAGRARSEEAAGLVEAVAVTVAVRRKGRAARAQQGAAPVGGAGPGGADEAAGDAAADSVAVVAVVGSVKAGTKAPRRTKAVVAEEVRQDALRGVFAPHVSLHDRYPHSRLYGPGAVALPPPALAVAAAENARLGQAAGTGADGVAAAAERSDAAEASAGDSSAGGGVVRAAGAGAERSGGAGEGPAAAEGEEDDGGAAAPEDASGVGGKGRRGGKAGRGGRAAAKPKIKSEPPLPALVHPMPPLIPNLGYACLCATLREHDIFASRDTNKAGFQAKGLEHVSRLALANARDLRPLVEFNEAHGIRFFRLSSGIFPWMSFYSLEELPDAEAIKEALLDAGEAAKRHGHRLTFHPSEFTKIASDKPEVVETSIKELEVHSRIFDLMGFLPATPYNKINIHVGGVYGDKVHTMDRFAKVVLERLSPNCRARLTVENDDRASMFSVQDLAYLASKARIPIVFDFHHHRFCTGGLSEEEAFRLALGTWPPGVRPVVHWSESQEGRRPHAHSNYVSGPINLYGLEEEVDVMIESKAKELALLHYREAAMAGRAALRPALASSLAALVADE